MPICLDSNGENMQDKLEFNQENFDKLVKLKDSTMHALKSIVNGCVHPEIAMRAVFVDLAPIRKAITRHEELFGIDSDPKS